MKKKEIATEPCPNAWGRLMFRHPHVQSMWVGFEMATVAAQSRINEQAATIKALQSKASTPSKQGQRKPVPPQDYRANLLKAALKAASAWASAEHANAESRAAGGPGCAARANATEEAARGAITELSGVAPDDPLDWLLPCKVPVGAGVVGRGTRLRMLVARIQALHNSKGGSA